MNDSQLDRYIRYRLEYIRYRLEKNYSQTIKKNVSSLQHFKAFNINSIQFNVFTSSDENVKKGIIKFFF